MNSPLRWRPCPDWRLKVVRGALRPPRLASAVALPAPARERVRELVPGADWVLVHPGSTAVPPQAVVDAVLRLRSGVGAVTSEALHLELPG